MSTLFTNRLEFHPRKIARIAEDEVDALVEYLKGTQSNARQHGIDLCHKGLSKQSMVLLVKINRDFFKTHIDSDPSSQLISAQYRYDLMDGFYDASEEVILREQDAIREAFQIALNHSFEQIQIAQQKAQRVIEDGYHNEVLALEEERRRISRELHDQAGQALVGVRLSLQNLLVDDLEDASQKLVRIKKVVDSVDCIINDIRNLAYKLRPPVLDLLGINMALNQLCYEFSDQTGLIIEYHGIDFENSSDEIGISLYRFVQEALTNIAKHARATHAWVNLSQIDNLLVLTVADNGKGFNPEKTKFGVGLSGMKERIRLLKGGLEIFQDQSANTVVSFRIPLKALP